MTKESFTARKVIALLIIVSTAQFLFSMSFTHGAIYNPPAPQGSASTFQYNGSAGFAGAAEMTYTTSTGQTKFTAQSGTVYGTSVTTGGIVNITGTNTTSTSLVVTTNQGANQAGRMAVFNCQNAADPQDCVLLQSSATGSTPFNVKSSAVGKGGIKVEQLSTTGDSNASAISIDVGAGGGGTAAQGLFIDATNGGTTGALINARNNAKVAFQVLTNSSTTTAASIVVGSSNVAGCIELQDTTGTTKWYLTIVSSALQTTTTKPTNCN